VQDCALQMVDFACSNVTRNVSLLENSGYSGKLVLVRNIVGIELPRFASHCMCDSTVLTVWFWVFGSAEQRQSPGLIIVLDR